MAKFYLTQIYLKRITLDNVPALWRDSVEKLIDVISVSDVDYYIPHII